MGDGPRAERVMSARLKQIKGISEENEAEETISPLPRPPQVPPNDGKGLNSNKGKQNQGGRKGSRVAEKVTLTYTKGANLGQDSPIRLTGPPTPSVKAVYHRKVMENERARAAAYRKLVGRRNAVDLGDKVRKPRVSLRYGGAAGNNNHRSQSVMEKSTAREFMPENRAKSSMAEFSDTEIDRIYEKHVERYTSSSITKGQIKAFKEVFDLFDRNGGGTIDAHELNETLESVGIILTHDEIMEVLQVIDKDGNGEIDFEEFLMMMTNTERFIEAITENKNTAKEESGRQENLLFDALTEFMKKSALHSMDEIVDYYSHKYKKAQTPHVVNHYAAGARLIGLTERQLKEHLEHLKASRVATDNKYLKNSPYAMPLHIITSNTNLPAIPRIPKPRQRGRIKLFVHINEEGDSRTSITHASRGTLGGPSIGGVAGLPDANGRIVDRTGYEKLHHLPLVKRGFGWVSQHTEHIEVRLASNPLKKLVPFHALTAEDLPSIRDNVEAATLSYTKKRRRAQLQDNYKHWTALDASLISPQSLQEHFRGTYSIYSLVAKRHLQIHEPSKM